ncbi:hypothetical protein LINGRAHAP2_LOCUS29532 [Linum grandiflorum]
MRTEIPGRVGPAFPQQLKPSVHGQVGL